MLRKTRRRYKFYRSERQFDHPILFVSIDLAIFLMKVLLVFAAFAALYFALIQTIKM